jgi:ribosomal protein S18 acetylase RimI-like enzyme
MTAVSRCGPERASELAELAATTFRETYAGDVPADELERYVRSAHSQEAVERQLRDPRSVFFLATVEGRAAGYLKVNREPDALEIESLYVRATSQGTGIGGRLMAQAIGVASDAGLRSLWLGVWERNQRAIAFYEHLGFREYGSHAFQLGEIEHTDLLMRLELPPRPSRDIRGTRAG